MKKHINIPIFIPHLGCPNACVFCNQKKISGHTGFDRASVVDELSKAFATVDGSIPAQIAYFGGSFTGIEREDMISLLQLANEYIDAGKCDSIRISTRPDYINEEILDILREYRVSTIELGIQSMDDRVLLASGRGHTARDSERAVELIKDYGFECIGQMMVGLPASTAEAETETAKRICALGVHGARIYPTVVFAETMLAEMMKNGTYEPLTEESSVSRTADVLAVFMEHQIPVIRIGLQSGEMLADANCALAGGYHPAVGELVYSRYFRNLAEVILKKEETRGKTAVFTVAPSDVSKWIGQHGCNRDHFIKTFALRAVKVIPDGAFQSNTWRLRLE